MGWPSGFEPVEFDCGDCRTGLGHSTYIYRSGELVSAAVDLIDGLDFPPADYGEDAEPDAGDGSAYPA